MNGASSLQLFLLLILFSMPSCLSTPGLFKFSQANAFIEIDTQPFSCSRDIQKLFSLSFDIYPNTNSSILFTGISGSLIPDNPSENASDNFNYLGTLGGPLALIIYTERPYFRLVVMRPTDHQVRLYLHHAFGYFDVSWKDWHRVEVLFTRTGSVRTEINFKVDQKINRGTLHTGDILWPDWAELKAKAVTETSKERRFYFNEAFLGFPPNGTMSRFATDTLMKYHDDIRSVIVGVGETDGYKESFAIKFGPFRGAMKSFLIASECACGMIGAFGPRMTQIGSGIQIQSVCDVSAVPPLSANISGFCHSTVSGLPCGCVGTGTRPNCYCPLKSHCSALKPFGFKSTRVGLLQNDFKMPALSDEVNLSVNYVQEQSLKFLAEGPITYNHLDSCFANIFLCEKNISYKFWMFVDPAALTNGSFTVIKHASHWKSPWYMQISYKGPPKGVSDPEHIMKISAEIRAPPYFTWNIDGCNTGLRVTPGQWHQVTVRWDKKTLTLLIDENLCCIASQRTLVIKATSDQRFGARITPFVFIGDHRVQDFIFNGVDLLPTFFRYTQLADSHGGLALTPINNQNDFYSVFRLDQSKRLASIRLPGVNVTVLYVNRKLVVNSRQQECSVFQLPKSCAISDSCSVEVERRGPNITVLSQNLLLNTEADSKLCSMVPQQISQTGLMPNSQVLLFNRGRSELLRRHLIRTTHFPSLDCNFDHPQISSSHSPLYLVGMCKLTEVFPSIQVQFADGPSKLPLNGVLVTSSSQLVLHPLATNLESYCLRDLQLCQFGLTMSFWILPLPITKASKVWPVLRQSGPSGSQLTVDLVRTDGQYNLETIVRITAADNLWTLVTISWSHIAGLSVRLNGTLMGAARESYREVLSWAFPFEEGLWFGHRGKPDMEEGVIIDNFQFIPAELNYLAFVNQKIDVELSNQGLKLCRYNTCLDSSSCYPVHRNDTSLGEFCRCEHPLRVCKELPLIPKNSTISSPSSLLLQIQNSPASSSPSPKTTTTMRPASESPLAVSKPFSVANHAPNEHTDMIELHGLAPQSPTQRNNVSSTPRCNPPCQNGGKCVISITNGEFICDCSETAFWGGDCSREHVGWLTQDEGGLGIEPHPKLFAIYGAVHSNSKQRFIFRTQILKGLDFAPDKHIRKSVIQPLLAKQMALLTVKSEFFTYRLVTTNCDLFLVTEGDATSSQAQLIPCAQNSRLKLNDGALHVVEVEHHDVFLRAKVDGVAVYPAKAMLRPCDSWLFFGLDPHTNNLTYEKKMIPDSKEARPSFDNVFLGSWPDGEEEFKGAIGGWVVDDEEMIMPITMEPKDTPNTLYRLNRRFDLSNGDFYWIRLNSLSPVTVLVDGVVKKTPADSSNTVWFWAVGCIILGLLLLLFICWACLRIRGQREADRKVAWRRSYAPFKPMMTKSPSSTSQLSSNYLMHPLKGKEEALSTLINGSYTSPKLYRLKAYTTPYNDASALPMDNLWRARVLTLRPSIRLGSIASSWSPTATSTTSLCPYDESDDVEEIIVTPNGDSVITLATNHGISVKQWNTSDGSCHREILFQPKGQSDTRPFGIMSLHEKNGLLFADEENNAQLHPLNADLPSSTVQLPSTIWGMFPIGDLVLFVTASTANATKDFFASLHFWSPTFKALVIQSRLRVKPSWQKKGYLPQDAKRLQPLLGPNQKNLLLCWLCSSSEDYSFSITVNLSAVHEELNINAKPLVTLDPHISATLLRHPMNLHKTTFLTADIAVTGDTHGTLHIWDVQSGTTYRSVQSDPIPIDGPLLKNLAQYDFSHLTVAEEAGPITALAATEPKRTEAGSFTWFCSGDDSGCVVVRRCMTTANGASRNVATRIHAKFRPSFHTNLTYSADSVTCARLLSRSQWRTNKPEAFLATGDLSGCIRVWLLPQCTQLAQLSASCESGLRDLALTQSNPSTTLANQWLQVVGLVRREKCVGPSYEHGRVVVIHLSAREENGVPNAMHSPRIRIVHKV
ncbi:hypothetical protein ECG_04010 [Echinococcus granulosus]|uniref:Concanavalin A lectin glucanase n=2 Tax=Echinococcus granulosus TaxID=6210 RepID=A0A068WGZ6_ECHGR|nr:hypothetical protein ECG_04010 [Echinococcus granulosus]CDS17711.1 Concanavalin A lectin glucanase [Echinococcus granulosus]